jgi:hypothetical protein
MIESEIVPDQFLRSACKLQHFARLFYIDWLRADRSDEPAVNLFPMKDLAGIERAREIEIGRRDFSQ